MLIELDAPAFKSENYKDLIEKVNENVSQLPDTRVVDGLVYKRTRPYEGISVNEDFNWKLWVPTQLIEELISKTHGPSQVSHGGLTKTLKRRI